MTQPSVIPGSEWTSHRRSRAGAWGPGCRESAQRTYESPLTLSFSPWEKGRLNDARSVQHRPLSHGERDRVRGVTSRHRDTWVAAFGRPVLRASLLALALLAPLPAPANAWSLWNEMIEQISIKPQEKPLAFPAALGAGARYGDDARA